MDVGCPPFSWMKVYSLCMDEYCYCISSFDSSMAKKTYIHFSCYFSWSNSSLQVLFIQLYLSQDLQADFYILSCFCLTFHSSKGWIVTIGFWFSSLNWTEMFCKAFLRPWVEQVYLRTFLVLLRKIWTLCLCVQSVYSSWIF